MSRRFSLFSKILVCLVAATAAGTGSALADPLAGGDGSGVDNDRLLSGRYPPAFDPLPVGQQLREPYDGFFDLDWSVALRGSLQHDKLGDRFEVIATPELSLSHVGARSTVKFGASTDVRQPVGGPISISGLRLSLDTTYALDSVTKLVGNADFSVSTPATGTPGQASNIAIAPTTMSGSADVGVTRQFGKFNIGVTGSINRTVYGATTLVDASIVDNSEQNLWSLDSGLRVGFQATPIFELFGQAEVGRDLFDKPSSVLLQKPDATRATLKFGLKGQWNSILTAQIAAGFGWHHFDAASLGEVSTNLYDASLSFTPDPTLKMTAGFSTTVTPPGPLANGTMRVEYGARGAIDYTVNSWLTLRSVVAWRSAHLAGSPDLENGYSYGVGADYKINAHTAMTIDYGFDHAQTTATGPEDSHRFTLGLQLSR